MLHDIDIETRSEAAKLYLFLFAIVAFIVCTIGSCSELQYMSSGKVAGAQVEKIRTVMQRQRRGPDYEVLVVSYALTDGAATRHEMEEVDPDWYNDHSTDISDDKKTIQVEYLPGKEGRSRLLGNSRRWMIFPFLASLALIVYATVNFWRSYAAYQRRLAEER